MHARRHTHRLTHTHRHTHTHTQMDIVNTYHSLCAFLFLSPFTSGLLTVPFSSSFKSDIWHRDCRSQLPPPYKRPSRTALKSLLLLLARCQSVELRPHCYRGGSPAIISLHVIDDVFYSSCRLSFACSYPDCIFTRTM